MLRYKSGHRRSESNHSRFRRDRERYISNKKKKKNFYVIRVCDDPECALSVFVGKIEQTHHAILHHVRAYTLVQLLFEL